MGPLTMGTIVGQRYKVLQKIGEGQFAEVYEVLDTLGTEKYALKIDRRPNIRTVAQESKIVQKLQSCQHVCRFVDRGQIYDGRNFLVMELAGSNLAERKRSCKTLALDAIKNIMKEALDALREIHVKGYVHRDVKPANLVVRKNDTGKEEWILLDFGLTRRFVDSKGTPMKQRESSSFRGSTIYASLNAHENQDLGCRDDVWSWFYILIELLQGTLPWRCWSDKAVYADNSSLGPVATLKKECLQAPEKLLMIETCPKEILDMNTYLLTLNYEDTPDYRLLMDLLMNIESQMPNYSHATTFDNIQQHPSMSGKTKVHRHINSEGPSPNYQPRQSNTIVLEDTRQSYGNILQLISLFKTGEYSDDCLAAMDLLRKVKPGEMIAALCHLIDDLVDFNQDNANLPRILNEVAAYIAICAKKCEK